MMRLHYERMESWPPLAWLAECRPSDPTLRVSHGPAVEVRDDWFCEAVWDGPFEAGAFDQTDLIFGSGGRLRGTHITFVPSGATVDRLHTIEIDGVTRVSNSLPCLLAAVGGHAEPTYARYYHDFYSIVHGLNAYKRYVPTSVGPARLIYFNNVVWDGATLSEVEKPGGVRKLDDFVSYRSFLSSALGRCLANTADENRTQRFRPLGTLSSGYDSSTIAALGREHGLREALSFTSARGGVEDGRPIAEALGIEIIFVPREAWQARCLAEVPFLVGDGRGEDVYFSGAEEFLRGRVLLTGFHGDKIWGKGAAAKALTSQIKRGDQSGLTLTEYRLWAGFIHFPVPFMGVRHIRDVQAISNSPEMHPWDVPGQYSRPICRRIVEEAGVPRGVFGVEKKAASVLFGPGDLTMLPETCADHVQWSRAHRDAWLAGGRLPPHLRDRALEVAVIPVRTLTDGLAAAVQAGAPLSPAGAKWLKKRFGKCKWIVFRNLRKMGWYASMFPWAIEKAKERYRIGEKGLNVGDGGAGFSISDAMDRAGNDRRVPDHQLQ